MENKPEKVDIVIPIYNALDYLKLAVKSVLEKEAGYPFRLILLNDCSPDKNISKYLKSINDDRVVVMENEENLGFTGTCKKAIEFSNTDVLLLNSDTEVTKGWLGRIVDCAYSNSKIATVSPFTNSGAGILNIPDFYYSSNPIPDGYDLDSWGETITEISMYSYPKTLTNVGYCWYIKRKVVDKIGNLDHDTFGKGYAEETDFCIRAQRAGFIHVSDDSTFIQHEGKSPSYKDLGEREEDSARAVLVKKNEAIIEKNYPEFRKWLDRVLEEGPTTPMHKNWWFHLDFFSKNQRIMHIIHAPVETSYGGIELFTKFLTKYMPQFDHYLVYVGNKETQVTRLWDKLKKKKTLYIKNKIKRNDYKLEDPDVNNHLNTVIDLINPSVVHIQSLKGLPLSVLDFIEQKEIPTILHLHDFSIVCPPYWDIDVHNKTLEENIEEIVNSVGTDRQVRQEREYYEQRLNKLEGYLKFFKKIYAPSDFVAKKFTELYPILDTTKNLEVLENGIDIEFKDKATIKENKQKLKIAFVGTFASHKGARQFLDLINKDKKNTFEWVIAGHLEDEYRQEVEQLEPRNINVYEDYDNKKLQEILEEVDIVLMPSQFAETFSIVLSEVIAQKIHVISTDVGAVGDRLKKYNIGDVVQKEIFENKAWDILNSYNKNRKVFKNRKKETEQVKVPTAQEVAKKVYENYKEILKPKREFEVEYKKELNKIRVESVVYTTQKNARMGMSKKKKIFFSVVDAVSNVLKKTPIHRPIKKIYNKTRKKLKI